MRPHPARAVVVDFETEVSGRYSLERMSVEEYVRDERFFILGVALAVPGDKIRFYPGEPGPLEAARGRLSRMASEGFTLVAHNVLFESTVLEQRWGIVFSSSFDTTGYLRHLGLRATLENGARFLGLEKLAAPEFNRRSLADLEARRQLARYCATDVALAGALFQQAMIDPMFSDLEFFLIDQTARINREGVRIDQERARVLAQELRTRRNESLAKLALDYGFDPGDLNSVPKVKAFLRSRFAIDAGSLDQRDPALMALRAAHPEVDQFLTLRERIRLAEKYAKVAEKLREREAITGALRYYGARTGRFSAGGRDAGKFNLHSLPKGAAELPEIAEMRQLVTPRPVRNFVAGDSSQVEARIVAFLAGESEMLPRFASGEDIYIWFAQQAFPGVEVVKNGVNGHLRQAAKAAVLGLGFGMGEERFLERLRAEDPNFNPQLGKRVFEEYQSRFPRIAQLRGNLWQAFRGCLTTHARQFAGLCGFEEICAPEERGGVTLLVTLPTGRPLYYRSILTTTELAPWGLATQYWFASAYEVKPSGGRASAGKAKQRKFPDGRMRSQVYSQVLVENIVQAIARDLLMAQMRELELHDGLKASFHVHDEVVVECEACRCSLAETNGRHAHDCPWAAACKVVGTQLSTVPACFPRLQGLPLACEVSKTIRERYG